MAMTLRELYESTNKRDIKLIAGKNGLDNVVRWAHMIEGKEISTYLEGQELSFVTGIALGKDESLFELVKHTYYNQASGMVINIGPYIEGISEEILQFCDENDFPLFQIPWHIYMANFIKDFCYQITISDRINIELLSAIKNAIFFPDQENLYKPQLEIHNFSANWPYCIAIIEILENSTGEIIGDEKRAKLLKNIENILIYSYKRTFIFELKDRFVLVFAEYSEDEIRNIVHEIKRKCREILKKKNKMYFCIGETSKNIYDISKSYHQAISILKLQKKRENSDEITAYSELGLYKLLLSMQNKEAMSKYYQETLEPLAEYDKINGTDYMIVLDTYLKNNCSVKEVAAQLFYHRNSINYKLSKIQEILSCDLSQLNTRLVYSIALMLREII